MTIWTLRWLLFIYSCSASRDWFKWLGTVPPVRQVHVYMKPPFNWLHKNCTSISTPHLSNYPSFKHADDWYFARAATRSVRRTSPANAKIFVVPALLNLQSAAATEDEFPDRHWHTEWKKFCCDIRGVQVCHTDLVRELDNRLSKSKWFLRSGGKDHFLVASHWIWKFQYKKHKFTSISACSQINFDAFSFTTNKQAHSFFHTYVGKNCRNSSFLRARLHSTKAIPGFHFIGDMTLKNPVEMYAVASSGQRKLLCDAVALMPTKVVENSFCASSSYKYSVYNVTCDHGRGVACNIPIKPHVVYCDNRKQENSDVLRGQPCEPSPPLYCESLSRAGFVLHARGDSWTSSRLSDAIDNGLVPVYTITEQLFPTAFKQVVKKMALSLCPRTPKPGHTCLPDKFTPSSKNSRGYYPTDDPSRCPHHRENPRTCWAESAREDCKIGRSLSYLNHIFGGCLLFDHYF